MQTTSKLVANTIVVDVAPTPGGCILACPSINVPITFVAPPVVLPSAQPYTVEYAVTNCSGMRTVIATKAVLARPACAFDRSLSATRTTSGALTFSWCDPSYSPFPDAGESVTTYRIFVVGDNSEPILVQEQKGGTSATLALSNREATARSAFVEASLCDITIAGCRDSANTLKSNVIHIDVAPSDGCSFGGSALCLAGRFSVAARFHTASGSSPAHPVSITNESGYFWFFGPDNAEVTVKAIDACSLSGKFWIFAAGMTDVGVDLTVTDTKAGVVRRYSAPAGKAFQPILDTDAFATCP
jgi:hypothetical protein